MSQSPTNVHVDPPQNPAGEFVARPSLNQADRKQFIDEMAEAPARWKSVLLQIPKEGLDIKYRNWTIRQITHHINDSHTNSYVRFKWTLTENEPLIKAYDEAAWVQLADCVAGDIMPALNMLDSLHQKWCQLLRTMSESDFQKTFRHPETDSVHTLDDVLQYYPWHSRHHLGQILWLAEQNAWSISLD